MSESPRTAPGFIAHGVSKRFGKRQVLDRLELEVVPGQVTALLGENGAGKSTLFKLALGLLEADRGTLTVAGLDPRRDERRLRAAVGYVPDKPDVYGWMTVPDLFRFLRPHYPTWDVRYAAKLLEDLRIPVSTPFKALSRGEGMKAMLAAALAPRPRLLLLDEPFAGLDPLVREEVLRGVIGELRDGERTVLMATHDLDVVARVADRVAILAGGRIVKHEAITEAITEPVAGSSARGSADDEPGGSTQRLRDALAEAVR